MGQEGQEDERIAAMEPFRLDEARLAAAPRLPGRPALPSRAPRPGDHRRGAGRPRQPGLGPGREPAARPEGAAGLAASRESDHGPIPVTKAGRLAQIAGILAAPGATPVRSQEDLAARLDRLGVHVTQATLSRDLVELGAVRLRGPDGVLAYSLPAEPLDRPGAAPGRWTRRPRRRRRPRPRGWPGWPGNCCHRRGQRQPRRAAHPGRGGAAAGLGHRPRGLAVDPRHRRRRRHRAGHLPRPGRRRRAGPVAAAAGRRAAATPRTAPDRSPIRGRARPRDQGRLA